MIPTQSYKNTLANKRSQDSQGCNSFSRLKVSIMLQTNIDELERECPGLLNYWWKILHNQSHMVNLFSPLIYE